MMNENRSQFIDAESGNYSKESSYEQVVLRQMQHCVTTLSEDVYGGVMKIRMSKSGRQETYIEDVREKIINSVDTFRMLILHFVKEKQQKQLDEIYKSIKEFSEKLGERTLNVRGKGRVQIKNLGAIPQDSLVWKEFSTFKANKYRSIFEILIKVYTKNKQEISSFSEE